MEDCVKEPKKVGRPWRGGPNPVRQVGRWSESSWDAIKAAAKSEGKTTAEWVRQILLSEAGRVRLATSSPALVSFLEKIR